MYNLLDVFHKSKGAQGVVGEDDFRALTAGVRPGGLNKTYEIRLLLCYMLSRVDDAVNMSRLVDAVMSEELANYFEVKAAVAALVTEGLIQRQEDGELLTLTERGAVTTGELAKSLPLTVRERAESALIELLRKIRLNTEVPVSIVKTADGYEITAVINDAGTPLLKFSMYMPTMEQCTVIQQRIQENPIAFYKGMFALATNNITTFEKARQDMEEK